MVNRRALLFLGLALTFAFAAAFMARNLLVGQEANAAKTVVETSPVVVARVDLGVGSALRSQQLDTIDWPKKFLPDGTFQSKSQVEDRVLRRALAAGEPILAASLLPQGSAAGLSSLIEKELRAVSVKVDPVIGVAGFVRPGTRVDVLATLRRIDLKNKLPYSKVILQDVPVLAIDQQLEEARNGDPELVSVVTLQVTPKQAEQLAYSAHEGRLQLALRGPGDHETVKTKSVGVADLLSSPRKRSSGGRAQAQVQVLMGSDVSVKKF
jgi:pilus assembly protein CpaB